MNSIFLLSLMAQFLSICILCVEQSPNKSTGFSCSKENTQNCILNKHVLECAQFSSPVDFSNSQLHFNETLNFKIDANRTNAKCRVSWKRRKAKNHRCAIEFDDTSQKRNFNKICHCHCTVYHKASEIRRREISNNSSSGNFTVLVKTNPQIGQVDVEAHLVAAESLQIIVYCLKDEVESFRKRTYTTTLNTTSADGKVQDIYFKFNVSSPGNYTLRFRCGVGKVFDKNFVMVSRVNSSLLLEVPKPEPILFKSTFIIFIGFFLLVGTISGIIIFVYFHRKKQASLSPYVDTKAVPYVINELPILKVLIIYGEYDETHVNLIKLFANLLENSFKCKIIADWINEEKCKIAEGFNLWLSDNIESCDKVIIVNSRKTHERYKEFISGTIDCKQYDSHYMYSMFSHFLKIVCPKPFYYKNMVNVRFCGTSKECILEHVGVDSLEVPLQLEELFISLHNLNRKYVADNFDLNWKSTDQYIKLCENLKIHINTEDNITLKEPHSPNSTTALISHNNSTTSFQFSNEC